MRKTILFLAALGVAGAALLGFWLVWGGGIVVLLGPAELQKALELGFPIEKTYLLVVKVDLRDPEVRLSEASDRIGIVARVRVGLLDTKADERGTAELSCKIRFDASQGAFFADDPRVERLDLEGHSRSHLERTQSALTWVLRAVLDRTPVYTLRAGEARESFARLILKDVRVKGGKLRLVLGVGS